MEEKNEKESNFDNSENENAENDDKERIEKKEESKNEKNSDYIIEDEIEKKDEENKEEEEGEDDEAIYLPLPDNTPSELKEEGNQLYREKDYSQSLMKYQIAIRVYKSKQYDDEPLIVTLHSNCAQCYLILKNYDRVISESTKAIEIDEKHLKSLYRRAIAYEHKEEYTNSFADLKRISEVNSGHKLAAIAMARVGPLAQQQQKDQLKEVWSGLKDLGGKLLGTFGIDINDIKFNKSGGGGYSMSMGGDKENKEENNENDTNNNM